MKNEDQIQVNQIVQINFKMYCKNKFLINLV